MEAAGIDFSFRYFVGKRREQVKCQRGGIQGRFLRDVKSLSADREG